jgi:Fe-S cluster assembly ATPase SufC
MLTSIQELIVMATRARPPSKTRHKIEDRVRMGICLCCDRPASRRGLCVRHYHQYRRTLLARAEADRVDFERRAIQAGKVLPRNKAAEIKRPNPFEGV